MQTVTATGTTPSYLPPLRGPLAGIGDADLRDTVGETDDNRRYRYANAPQVTSTFPGYSTVVVKLIAMIESADARVD